MWITAAVLAMYAVLLAIASLIKMSGLMEVEGDWDDDEDIDGLGRRRRRRRPRWRRRRARGRRRGKPKSKLNEESFIIRIADLDGGALTVNPAVIGNEALIGTFTVPDGMALEFRAFANRIRHLSQVDIKDVALAAIPGRVKLVHLDVLNREKFTMMDEDAETYGSASLVDKTQMLPYNFGGKGKSPKHFIRPGHKLGIKFTPSAATALVSAECTVGIYCFAVMKGR